MNLYYLGPQGSYSSIVAHKAFAESFYAHTPVENLRTILAHVQTDKEGIGIVPIENSITSNVHESMDYLFETDLKIIGEARLKITLHLIGRTGTELSKVTKVYSHPQALHQCSAFLQEHKIDTEEVVSTAAGQRHVLAQSGAEEALIGSGELAKREELEILADDLGNVQNNVTRFLFVGHKDIAQEETEQKRATFTFRVKHEAGALVDVLNKLAAAGANLTSIESRPIPGSDFEYKFWIDVEAHSQSIDDITAVIKKNTAEHRVLGVYPKGDTYES